VFMLSDSRNPIKAFQLGHYDLLDLSDPKYSSSTNLIVAVKTLTDSDKSGWSTMTDQITWVIRPGSTSPTGARVINSFLTKAVEFVEPLPENFRINSTGSLMGFPTPEQYPASGQGYNKITAKIRVTLNDDYVEDRQISIYVVAEDIQSGDYDLDQELQVNLEFNNCQEVIQFCTNTGVDNNCNDNCGGTLCCDNDLAPGGNKFGDCNCVNP